MRSMSALHEGTTSETSIACVYETGVKYFDAIVEDVGQTPPSIL